jgi:hypothetical protein
VQSHLQAGRFRRHHIIFEHLADARPYGHNHETCSSSVCDKLRSPGVMTWICKSQTNQADERVDVVVDGRPREGVMFLKSGRGLRHQAPDMHDVGGADESGILACAVNAQ